MSEQRVKKTSKKDANNNITTMEAQNKSNNTEQIKNENLETTAIMPTSISYHSTLLPDAIFLTTSNGQLITTSSLNHIPVSLAELALKNMNEITTTPSMSKDKNEKETKSKRKDEKHGAPAKPSAKKKSAANPSTTKSTTKKKDNTLLTTTNFPFLTATGGLATALTPIGFSSQNNFTSGFAPITTFSLQNPLLTPGLTIPIYNSLVAVAGGTNKDIIVPTNNDKEGVTTPTVSAKKTKSKTNNSQNNATMTTSRGRKRTAQSRLPAKLKEPAAVARRNARERRRVKMVNDGFLRLRRHVPTDPKNKKLSKVKTLRLAIEYIHHLQQLLQTDSNAKNTAAAAQLVNTFSQVTTYEDLDVATGTWLHADTLGRVSRDMDEDIFQSIDPERLRTNFNDYVTR